MFWTDGSIYQGEWKQGIQHGFGKMVFPDGSVKEGHFENNIYVGVQDPEPEKPAASLRASRLQPLLVKKSVVPVDSKTNENKNQVNSGYNSSGGGVPIVTGKHQPLKPIKEEGTKTPNIFIQ